MKKKLKYLLMVVAVVLMLAAPAYAEGDKVRGVGDNVVGPSTQHMHSYPGNQMP